MSKLTPMILAVLMLASTSLVAMDWAELENNTMTEADGRAGPDAQVTSILSPRATTTDSITGEQIHTLRAGDTVDFEVYIENVGDADIEEMGVSLTVYLAENGERGMIAKDSAGNDLSWYNGDVVCDDSFVCPWSSLASGTPLDYGKYTYSYQGSPVSWTPVTGDYVIVVETNALGDADAGNDYAENLVSVVDWTDVIVDLAWDSGKEIEGGAGDKAFTLTVATGGSSTWSARSITVELDVQGTLSSAVDNNGGDIMGTTTVAEFGTYGMTETFRHETDSNNTTSDNRYVIDFQNQSEWFGVVSPDTSGDSGDYSVTVNVVSYVVYGQLPDCEETTSGNSSGQQGGETDEMTYVHFCEVTMYQDGDASTSEDMIEGKVQTFHDIGVSTLVINQGYTVDENGDAMTAPSLPGITQGPLNPAWSSVQASVRHMGSDLMVTYDWEVTFEITNTATGVTDTQVADNCTFGQGPPYTHMLLGDDMGQGGAFEAGEACIMFEFAPGVYNITATVAMVGGTAGTADMSARNNDASIYEISALNNRPSVSLTVQQDEGSIVIGPEGMITLEADAYDADDDTGQNLNYVWTHPGMQDINGTEQPSQCNGMGIAFSTCNLMAFDSEWAGVQTYSVTVTDEFGSSAMDFTNVFIWNQVVATATTASGIGVEYNLTYDGVNAFNLATWADSDASYTQDLTQFGYAGEYSSVAVVDYSPSTTYMPEDVYSQEIVMTFDTASLDPTSVFWISNGNWVQLDAAITSAGSSGTITVDLGENSQVLPQGEIALMGGELQIIEAPDAHATGLTVVATKGGTITASWSYSGNTVPGADWLAMEICDSADVCTSTQENTTLVAHSMNGQTDTVHGETYTYTLQVCNVGGCNPTIATASATADKMVDGDASATAMTVANKADANAWTVSWTADGDTSDVDGWMVCWSDFSWSTSGMMPDTCADAGAATSTDINHPGGTGEKNYYFTAVPYDDKGNMDNALPGTDILLTHESTVTDPCEENPDSDECAAIGGTGDGADSGEVPTWTWGVIIGLVVIAFVVGAFILSRGGDGDDGKDWDY